VGVGFGLYMYDVVVKRSRSLSYLLMSYFLFLGYLIRILPTLRILLPWRECLTSKAS